MPALLRDRRGASAILVGLSAPALLGGLALSVDVGTWYLQKRKLQQISDTASLGAISVLRSGGSVELARRAALRDAERNGFEPSDSSSLTVNVPPVQGPNAGNPDAVEVVVAKKLPLLFAGYFLADGNTVQARSVAIYNASTAGAPRRNLEVALILDVSASMAGPSEIPGVSKLKAMQEAAKKVVDVVVQDKQEPFSTRVAIVPYGTAVSVGDTYFRAVTNSQSSTWSAVIERTGASAFTDDAPGPGSYFPDYQIVRDGLRGRKLTVEMIPQTKQVAVNPLSADKDQLQRTIDGFQAEGKTAGHIGLAWAWNVLSPKWGHIWSADGAPTDYDSDKTFKVAVLLSDFDMTVTYTDANGTASDQAMTLCSRMKEAGITIYTLGYRVPTGNATAARLWQGCASDSDKVYSAQTAEELIAAFAAIAQSAAGQVMTLTPRLAE
ncbi:MAG: pilus assembly protein [Alphaproteobacteria bacterium]|nr:pilus assembly protein [Alphaproteobacteria bacterium]